MHCQVLPILLFICMLSELDGALWPCLSKTILAAGDPVWSLRHHFRLPPHAVNVWKCVWYIYIYINYI